jgi:V/A-type H+-transporting ATPase subunit K
MTTGLVLTILGGVLSAVLTAFGSARMVGKVGESASGVVSQDPSLFSKVLLLQLLPGTQGLYGLLVAVLLFSKIGLLGGNIDAALLAAESAKTGMAYFAACMPMALGGMISAFYQGRTAIAGVALVAKKPEHSGKAVMMSAMVETYAILSLLISVIVIYQI